jgi:putative transcriptional regulator
MEIANNVSTLTVARVAKGAGLSYEAVQRLYNGSSKQVDLITIDKLCQVLECEVSDLFEYVAEAAEA